MPPPLALQTHDHPPTSSREVERQARRPHPLVTTYQTALHHVKKHAGVGIVCAVAYFDPQVPCLAACSDSLLTLYSRPQRKLECRYAGWVQLRIQTYALCHSNGRPGGCCTPGKLDLILLIMYSSASHHVQTMAAKLGCVTGAGNTVVMRPSHQPISLNIILT